MQKRVLRNGHYYVGKRLWKHSKKTRQLLSLNYYYRRYNFSEDSEGFSGLGKPKLTKEQAKGIYLRKERLKKASFKGKFYGKKAKTNLIESSGHEFIYNKPLTRKKGFVEVKFLFSKGKKQKEVYGRSKRAFINKSNFKVLVTQAYRMALRIADFSPDNIEIISYRFVYYEY